MADLLSRRSTASADASHGLHAGGLDAVDETPTCSARYRTPLPTSSSNVSPRIGLKGFQARSMQLKGDTAYAATQANLGTEGDSTAIQTPHPLLDLPNEGTASPCTVLVSCPAEWLALAF